MTLQNRIFAPAPDDASAARDPAHSNDDSLTNALLFLAAHHGRALSREALLAGLPIEGRLDVTLFGRAAERANLECELVKRQIEDIPDMVLPAVLVMSDGTVRILLKQNASTDSATILNPGAQSATETVSLQSLSASYLGYTFFLRPRTVASPAVGDVDDSLKSHWFWSVVAKYWSNYSHVAIAAFLVNVLALASPLFVMNVYDRVVPNGAIPSLIALSIGLCLAIAFDFVLRIVRSNVVDVTGKKIDVVLAANIFEHVIALKLANRPTSIGVLANQLRDFDSVRDFFTSGTVTSITDLLFAMLFIAALFWVAGPLAWIPLAMLPIMIALGVALQYPLNRAMKRLQMESSARHGVLVESLAGMETVRAVAGEARMQTVWERSVAATAKSSEGVHFWSSLALTISNTAQQITSLLLVIIGVFLIIDGKMSVGALVAANMLAGRVLAPIAGIAALITRATQTFIALKSIDRLMSLDRERPLGRTYVARAVRAGSIEFENVSFQYPATDVAALEGISFRITPGESVGIIGRIGSGKTTVGRLMAGFYDPTKGRILVDGVDIRQYDPADLRGGLGLVLQDTDLFLGSLRDNIALGRPSATDEDILAAARLSGVESFAASHASGYEMLVAEGGRNLSGGQRQAIGLARILVRKPKILFLDEPTAHFDVRSETEFLERLKGLASGGLTTIVATHRLSLLGLVNRLLVFDRGRLILDGPRQDVMAKLQAGRSADSKTQDGVSNAPF